MFPDFVGAKDVRHRWKPLLTSGVKENRSGARRILPTGLLTAFDGQVECAMGVATCRLFTGNISSEEKEPWLPIEALGQILVWFFLCNGWRSDYTSRLMRTQRN
jgi:hypothetical protein